MITEIQTENRLSLYEKCILCTALMLILQSALQFNIPIFQYFDELLTGILMVMFFLKLCTEKNIHLGMLLLIDLLLLLITIGLLGNFFNNRQPNRAILMDIFLCFKFLLIYVTARYTLTNFDKKNLRRKSIPIIEAITMLLMIVAIADVILNIFPSGDQRYGLSAKMLFFHHPSYYSSSVILIAVYYLICIEHIRKRNIAFLIMLSVMGISSLRSKAIASIVILWLFIIILHYEISIKVRFFFIAGIICFLIAREQIFYYLIDNDDFARSALMTKGFEIAAEYFPIGAGFSSFATYASGVYYSKIYILFHLNHIYGLRPDQLLFVSDTFWPAVLGQFGVLGTILFCILLIVLFVYMRQNAVTTKEKGLVYFSAIYMLILSMAESSFFNPLAVALFFILSVFI